MGGRNGRFGAPPADRKRLLLAVVPGRRNPRLQRAGRRGRADLGFRRRNLADPDAGRTRRRRMAERPVVVGGHPHLYGNACGRRAGDPRTVGVRGAGFASAPPLRRRLGFFDIAGRGNHQIFNDRAGRRRGVDGDGGLVLRLLRGSPAAFAQFGRFLRAIRVFPR